MFKHAASLFVALALFAAPAFAGDGIKVRLKTNKGDIVVEMNGLGAPLTVKNFLTYVRAGHYNNTLFHRVVKDFVIQGGGVDPDFNGLEDVRDPVMNESDNGLKNLRGTIAMARFEEPDSATDQFYINLKDNPQLDPRDNEAGYTVFGTVVEGMAVADAIGQIKTGRGGPYHAEVPVEPVILEKASVERPAKTGEKSANSGKSKPAGSH